MREQKDQISALISDISHQTKTPVVNLKLYAQLLSEQPLTPQGKDCAAAISAQAEKLQTLIEALVKTSRLETGILVLHPQPGVDEQGAVPAQEEVAVGLLPVAVLAEGKGGVVHALPREPGRHSVIAPNRASPSVPVIRTGRTRLWRSSLVSTSTSM